MLPRRYIFPHVIELNHQARRRIGVNVYLIDGGNEFVLIDIGYLDTVEEIVDIIRRMDFSISACRLLIATHADADHVQGLARAKEIFRCPAAAHRAAVEAIETGDRIITFAEIKAQDIDLPMPPCRIERKLADGETIELGSQRLEVWHTPGHTAGQLSFRMGAILFSGDNIYRDGGVGVIDAHHGSSIPDFIRSLTRIRDSSVEYLLPSHGPLFRKDNALLQAAIERLTRYQYMADFGTCAVDWPLMEEWDQELASGRLPFETAS